MRTHAAAIFVLLTALAAMVRAESAPSAQPGPAAPSEEQATYTAPEETVISPQILRDALAFQDAPSDINRDTQTFLDGQHGKSSPRPEAKGKTKPTMKK